MPELPDIELYLSCLEPRIRGRELRGVRLRSAFLLRSEPSEKKQTAAPKPKRPSREALLALRSEVRKSEARVEKLHDMHAQLSEKLANPALYEADKIADLEVWQKKFAEVEEAIERAETLWLTAQEKLEDAEANT